MPTRETPVALPPMEWGTVLAIWAVALVVAPVVVPAVIGGMYGFFLLWTR